MVAHEKHEGNESEDGDQGASPPAIFLFKTFDTSLERFRGPRTSSAGCFLRHDFTSLAGLHLKRFKSRPTTTGLLFFVSTSWCSVPMWLPSEPSKGKGRLSRAKSYGQTAVRSGFSDNIRKASTDPRP
jgi:hypothetical protein